MSKFQLPVRPEIILGPPGTGKTTALLQIVDDELVAGTSPDRIGMVTFTRRGAIEAQDRAMAKFELTRRDLPWFRTLHSLCMRVTGLRSSEVLERDRLAEFSDWVGERITGRFSMEEGLSSGYERGDRMLFMDGMARVRNITLREQYDEDSDGIEWFVVDRFSRALRQYKADHGLVDYTDMLEEFVRAGASPRLDVLIVDEAQDLSRLQWQVVAILCQHARRVVVAFDDDQAIYRWAGADVDTVLGLEGDVRVLGQSYRVPRRVQTLANSVVGRIGRRRPKAWRPRDEDGSLRWLSGLSGMDWTQGSYLVLARNQYLLRPIMDDLRSSGVLYQYHGHPSVRQAHLDAIVAWEHLRQGLAVPVAQAQRAYDLMTSGVGVARGHKRLAEVPEGRTVTMSELRESCGLMRTEIWHEALDKIPAEDRTYMVRCRRQGERFSVPPRVRVGTIHEAKGGEADRVVLLTDMAPRTHDESLRDPDSEARVFYVGATRARLELNIVGPRTRRHFTF